MIELRKQGKKLREIADMCHCDIKTVCRWCKKYEKVEGDEESLKSKSHAPKNPQRTPKEIKDKVVKMKKEHREWGDKRIVGELMKEDMKISNGNVYNILREAGYYPLKKIARKRQDTMQVHLAS